MAQDGEYLSADPLVYGGEHISLVTVHDGEYSSGDLLVDKLGRKSSVTHGQVDESRWSIQGAALGLGWY